jgi:ElaB/YqjD/DUF883 family membrane-anchored ribosome-binding protein
MELYYKDLISEEASLEKLVDELMLVVQGADEFAAATGAALHGDKKEEIISRLNQLKAGCRRITEQAIGTAAATDKLLRRYPYTSAGLAFALGLLTGALLARRR